MIVWGVISAATAGCKSPGGLLAVSYPTLRKRPTAPYDALVLMTIQVRFFLGFVEAAYFPGCEFCSDWRHQLLESYV